MIDLLLFEYEDWVGIGVVILAITLGAILALSFIVEVPCVDLSTREVTTTYHLKSENYQCP